MRREMVAALNACPTPEPALDADTVMLERLNDER
jgi:hypothetical protein